MKTEHSSFMTDAVELKNKHLSYPACTCNLLLVVICGGKTNLPFWNDDMEWTGLSILSSPQVDFSHFFSLRRKYCFKTPQYEALFAACGVWELSPVWYFLEFFLILPCFQKCFNYPTSGKFGPLLAEKKLFTYGWTFLISSIGIVGGKNMLKKVSFVFSFTLESTGSSRAGR